jgi:hypothetical protein
MRFLAIIAFQGILVVPLWIIGLCLYVIVSNVKHPLNCKHLGHSQTFSKMP